MALACGLALALLVTGCSSAPPQTTNSVPPETCEVPATIPQSQPGTVDTLSHNLSPGGIGSSRDGHTLWFPWSHPSAFLRSIDVTMDWDVGAGQQQTLYLEVRPGGERADWHYTEGPPPVHVILQVGPGTPLADELMVVFGTAGNETPVGSLAVVSQDVTVTVQESYACF